MIYFRDDMKVRFSACGRAERARWKSVFVPRAPARVGAHVSLGIVSFRLDASQFRASGIRVSQNALLVTLFVWDPPWDAQ